MAIVLFGDPTHRNESSFKHSNGTGNGIFFRSDISACEALGNRIRSYCEAGDPYCDAGGAPPSAVPHLTYISNYGDEIARYVVDQYNTGGSGSNNSDSTPAPTAITAPDNGGIGSFSIPSSLIAATLLLVLGLV